MKHTENHPHTRKIHAWILALLLVSLPVLTLAAVLAPVSGEATSGTLTVKAAGQSCALMADSQSATSATQIQTNWSAGGPSWSSGASPDIRRCVLVFNTSDIPDNARVVSVSIHQYVYDCNALDNVVFQRITYLPPYDATQYDLSKWGNKINEIDPTTATGYQTYAFPDGGWINTAGLTVIGERIAHDYYNTGVLSWNYYDIDGSGTAGKEPYLIINWETGAWRPAFTTNAPTSAIVGKQYAYTPGCNESCTFTAPVCPSWLSFDGSNFYGAPTAAGSYPVSIKAVSNSGQLTAWQNFSINARAWGPAWLTTPPAFAATETLYSYHPILNESVSISAVSIPGWLTWTPANNTLWGTPSEGIVGQGFSVTLTTDAGPGGQSSTQSWTIAVQERGRWAPLILSSPSDRIEVGKEYGYAVSANESFTATYSGPSWLVINEYNSAIFGTAPPAPQTAHVSLAIRSDAGTLTVWQNWTITIWANAPEIQDPPQSSSSKSGESYSYSFGGSGWGTVGSPGPMRLGVTTSDNASWVNYDPYNGTIWGDPKIPGVYTINATVTNTTTGLSSSTEYTVTVSADAPTVSGSANQNVTRTSTTDLLTGEEVIIDTIWTGQLYSYMVTPTPDYSALSVTENADWLTWTPENRTLWGTPAIPGMWNVSLAVYDAETTITSWSNWTIQVIAPPPVIQSGASFSGVTNGSWSYTLQYSPADGLVSANLTEADWISYNANTHTFSGIPHAAGIYHFVVNVTNATTGMYALQAVTVTIEDDPPELVCNPIRSTTERTLYRWTPIADQAVTWSMTSDAGDWLSIDPKTGRISGTPNQAGEYSITIYATNARGMISSYTYTLTVKPYSTASDDNSNTSGGSSGVIELPGGITLPIGGTASYSTSITAPVIGFVAIVAILLLLMFRRRNNDRK